MNVYLAGTINSEPWTKEWRSNLARFIQELGHVPLDPMRYQNQATFTKDGLGDTSTPSSFFWKTDLGDLARADIVVVHYLCARGAHNGAPAYRRQSVGTWMEIGIAAWLHKPIIVITDDPDVRDHPAIQQSAAIVVETVAEAATWLRKMLIP